ncbi:hypothetical protein [Roseimaritima ulvae]|uniref:Uncharacterized protein n=1 Tax=Roseimaritima ulvae TaxID=980254 RepID=A0A5B9R9F1_9BACT|nr:hypothetical protein [Roseimaritima ulvae]QEG43443.1 hypothetical protein UC8_54920 [Roseimaritima ulvae]
MNILGFEFDLIGRFYLGEHENRRLFNRWTVGDNYVVTILDEKVEVDWRVRLEVSNESLIDVNESTYIVFCDQVWYVGYFGRKDQSRCSIRARWGLNRQLRNTFQIEHSYQADCGIDAMLRDGRSPELYICPQPTITRPDGQSLNVSLSLEDAIIANYPTPWNHIKTKAKARAIG